MRRPAAACALLFLVYGALAMLSDPRGHLGSDTGGKVATLAAMAGHGRFDPDLGYWAERWDPDGRVHPIVFIGHIGDRWVDATTLPALYVAAPLYRLGGYRMALLLPMAGAVLAALAARALARRCSRSDGAGAFWIVGLASPVAVYALDFWEHSVGLALMAWAMVHLIDVLAGRRPGWAALAAGALFGAAATLRTEALVYAAVGVVAACLVLLIGRREVLEPLRIGALAVAGAAVPLLANAALEIATVGGLMRSQRVAGTASVAADGASFAVRVKEAGVTAFSFFPVVEVAAIVIGLAVSALLGFSVVRLSKRGDAGPAFLALATVVAFYGVTLRSWPMFVPGMLAASPIAVVGLVRAWRHPVSRFLVAVGLVALPIVWATQWVGGAGPQWGGRYVLTSGLVFLAVGATRLVDLRRSGRLVLVGVAVAVTAMGVATLSVRSHGFAGAGADLAERSEPVLVSRVVHLAREGGAFYGRKQWLTARTGADLEFAATVVSRAGATSFGLVTQVEPERAGDGVPAEIGDWVRGRSDRIDFVARAELLVTTYVKKAL